MSCLSYRLKFSDTQLATITEACVKAKSRLPPEIENAPELYSANELGWRCFHAVRRGGDEGDKVPWRDVLLWAQAHGCSDMLDRLWSTVILLDDMYVAHILKLRKQKRDREAGGKHGNGPKL